VAGLMAAAVTGVLTYRSLDAGRGVGPPEGGHYVPAKPDLLKMGVSLNNDGVIDAWQYFDANGSLQRVDVSRRRDGTIDRREYYENGQLARAEEDNDHDGTVDHWLTYDAGILMDERSK
jgi:hypothetical protein